MLVGCLACAPVYATAPDAAATRAAALVFPGASAQALAGVYTGFGQDARGGGAGPVFWVETLADDGAGSLRDTLARARAAGGGVVLFALGGDIVLTRGLDVPADTTLDGLSAPVPGVTLWGDVVGERGVVNVLESNVIVRGLRIRNAANDGIHIAPKTGTSIRDVVIDHCSVTNSADGGIDVTGYQGRVVSDVTLSWNYVAGSGSTCAKGTCGGGALVKYGVDRISVHANLWDKNLRRNPTIDGAGVPGGTLADIRANVVRQYEQSGMQVVAGARANVIGNFFERPDAVYFPDGLVFMGANTPRHSGNVAVPFPVTIPITPVSEATVLQEAGALPRDEIDAFYLEDLRTWGEMKEAGVGSADPVPAVGVPTPLPTPGPPAAAPTVVWMPLDHSLAPATLAQAEMLRAVARTRGRHPGEHPEAARLYREILRSLAGASGPLAARAEVLMARTEVDLARLYRRRVLHDLALALEYARAAAGRCALTRCPPGLARAATRHARGAERALRRGGWTVPPQTPPAS